LTRNFDVQLKKLNLDIFLYPEKHSTLLPIGRLVADTKVDPDGVTRYKEQLAAGQQLRPIVVIKHPHKNMYAVIDGHHRFFAQLEYGKKDINCAVIPDFTGFMFNLTKDGWLQPHPILTKHVRIPILEFHQKLDQSINRELRRNTKQFLNDFHRHPEKLIEIFQKLISAS
jgi:hypothetical protein